LRLLIKINLLCFVVVVAPFPSQPVCSQDGSGTLGYAEFVTYMSEGELDALSHGHHIRKSVFMEKQV